MKRHSMLALALLLLGGCASTRLSAPPAVRQDVAVARFLVDIEGLEADYPGKASGLLPAVIEGVQTASTVKDAVDALKDPNSSPMKAAIDSVYYVIADGFAAGLDLHLLPLDTLRGEVPYVFGYPYGNPRRVAASGRYPGVLDLAVDVTFPDEKPSSWSIVGTGRAKVKGRPEITVRATLLDAAGTVVWRDQVRVRSREWVQLDERWVLGMRTRGEITSSTTLPEMVRDAVAALVQKHRA